MKSKIHEYEKTDKYMSKLTKLFLGFTLAITILSCSKEEGKNGKITTEDAKVSEQIDAMSDDVTTIVEEQEASTYSDAISGKTADLGISELTNCATITRVPAFGTAPAEGDTVTKTIDFGSSCTLDSGNVVSGIIVISFIYDTDATSHTINYSFENFFHNGIEYDGDKTFTRTTITSETDPVGHPQVTMEIDITATLPDGRVFNRTGTRIREIIEGFGNANFADNVYQITGTWVTTTATGATQNSNIAVPLHVKMSCVAENKPLIVYGIIVIATNTTTASLNFGDGTCDNLAVLTINGTSQDVVIGN